MSNPYLESAGTDRPSPHHGLTPSSGTVPPVPLRGATPQEALTRFARQAIRFDGRASRSEFWWPTAALTVASTVLQLVPFGALLLLVLLLPTMSLTSRRLHDIGRAGWWQASFYLAWLPFLAAGVPAYVAARRLEGRWAELDAETELDAYIERVLDIGGAPVLVATALLVTACLIACLTFALWLLWMTRGPQTRGDRFGPSGIMVGRALR